MRAAHIFAIAVWSIQFCCPESMDVRIVRELVYITPIAHMVDSLLIEYPAYVQAATLVAGRINRDDMHEFTESVLTFWRGARHLKAWRAGCRRKDRLLHPPNFSSCRACLR